MAEDLGEQSGMKARQQKDSIKGEDSPIQVLETQWQLRQKLGIIPELGDIPCIRVFYGPGEVGELKSSHRWLSQISIDCFGREAWITVWEGAEKVSESNRKVLIEFLQSKKLDSAVVLDRPKQGIPHQPEVLFGSPSLNRKEVSEGPLHFRVQLLGAKHPGLFLDHQPLRQWLLRSCHGLKVLNTFSYTGSLSVAAAVGGAREVHTLDLSRPTIEWAKENWELNRKSIANADSGKFWVADFFEWRTKENDFDLVILDPPSFSRGERKTFSTAKDLTQLHLRALQVLNPRGGILITSINSANVSTEKYRKDVLEACRADGREQIQVLRTIEQPETFSTSLNQPVQRYLKGWILAVGGRQSHSSSRRS